jgi:hypothetical protein
MRRTGSVADDPARVLRLAAPWIWGALLASVICRFFFLYAPGEMHQSADGASYVSRLVEFTALLRAGYAFPQWAVDFRAGLGSPYFGYYQPGFFYAASVFGSVLPAVRAIGMTLWCFSLFGYAGMFWLVRERFGIAAGVLAATALLLSSYSVLEIYLRGDFSEYAGMMTLPALLHWLTGWLDRGRASHWRALAIGSGALVMLHCVAGLLGYGVLALTTLCYTATSHDWRRALWVGAALLVGAGLAALYWMPLALEWNLVQGDRATQFVYSYARHFVDPGNLLSPTGQKGLVPVYLGRTVPLLVAWATVLLVVRHRVASPEQWRFVASMWALVIVCVFMIGPVSAQVWAVAPLLGRIQFPWRFMLVLTVATAALAGSMVAWQRTALVLGVAALVGLTATQRPLIAPQPLPAAASDIAKGYFAPDAMDEWLPSGAKVLKGKDVPRGPQCTPWCNVESFDREPGHLRVQLATEGETRIILPHYFFPVGWRATLDGAPVPLESTDEGLMRLDLPGGGVLDLTFTMTPMRRLGVLVSALTFVGWLVAVARAAGLAKATERALRSPDAAA